MKITGEADFFIKQYGLEDGLRRLRKIGYKNISYCINTVDDGSTFGTWSEREIEEHYRLLRDKVRQWGLHISYVTMDKGIYSHAQPDTFETRKSWCLQAVKVAAYLGCESVVIRPASIPAHCPDAYQRSKDILCEVISVMKAEGDKVGVQPAIENTGELHIYGNRGVELLELAKEYEVGILLNPSMAHLLRERIPCFTTVGYWDNPARVYPPEAKEIGLVELLKNHLLGVLLNDTERTMGNPVLPMTGVLDYREIVKQMGNCSENICLTVGYQPIYKRYRDFLSEESLVNTIAEYFYQLAVSMDKKEEK